MEQPLKLSPTVERTQARLADHKTVYALDIVKAILELHPEYGKRLKYKPLLDDPDSERKPFNEWLSEVRALFDQALAPELHGRLVIFGLAALDVGLGHQLQRAGIYEALKKELSEPMETILSEPGQLMFFPDESSFGSNIGSKAGNAPSKTIENHEKIDSVAALADDALQTMEEDQLGRAAYAEYLAERLMAISKDNATAEKSNKNSSNKPQLAFAVHLYGPWGSGKSTLLNFLRDHLEEKWLVVEFNAWRNQHIEPPWWALMEAVFEKAKQSHLSFSSRIREYWWRLRLGHAHYSLYIFVSACLFGLGFWFYGKSIFGGEEKWVEVAKNISVFISAIVGAWAAIQGFSRALLSSSTKVAEDYQRSSNNPMEAITKQFAKLISRIEADGKSERVIVFIDDLDRCQARYVVDLLEGLQTLFREKSVFFVVAADRRWLNACFEEVYSKLRPHVQEPGKHLGILFLEKVFQFSAPVPGLSPPMKKAYWQHLLRMKDGDNSDEIRAAKDKAKSIVDAIKTDAEFSRAIDESADLSLLEQQAIRARSIIKLATPALTKDIEDHTLSPFAHLLEPNPRSMKRLVNAYSINRTLSTLGHLDISRDKLVLWTILEMRWPELADHLLTMPDDLELIGNEKLEDEESSISDLMKDQDNTIGDVVGGKDLSVSLDIDSIKQCAMLRM